MDDLYTHRGISVDRSSALRILDNVINGFSAGITTNRCTTTSIEKNTVSGFRYAGIFNYKAESNYSVIDNKIYGNDQGIGIWYHRLVSFFDNYLPATISISQNCVFNTEEALRFTRGSTAVLQDLPIIKRNYLAGYSLYGLYIDGYQGNIGTTPADGGFNTFESTFELSAGAADIHNNSGGVINVGWNYGVNNLSFGGGAGPIAINNDQDVTSGCVASGGAKSIVNSNQRFVELLTQYYPVTHKNGQYQLQANFVASLEQQKLNTATHWGMLTSVLTDDARTYLVDAILTQSLGSNDARMQLKYYAAVAQENWSAAQSILEASNFENQELNAWKTIQRMQLIYRNEADFATALTSDDVEELIAIDLAQGTYAAEARDVLQAAFGGFPYRFEALPKVKRGASVRTLVLDEETFNLYPNPSNGQVNLEFLKAVEGPIQLQVINAQGKRVATKNLVFNGGQLQADFSTLSKGIYMLLLQQEDTLLGQSKLIIK